MVGTWRASALSGCAKSWAGCQGDRFANLLCHYGFKLVLNQETIVVRCMVAIVVDLMQAGNLIARWVRCKIAVVWLLRWRWACCLLLTRICLTQVGVGTGPIVRHVGHGVARCPLCFVRCLPVVCGTVPLSLRRALLFVSRYVGLAFDSATLCIGAGTIVVSLARRRNTCVPELCWRVPCNCWQGCLLSAGLARVGDLV